MHVVTAVIAAGGKGTRMRTGKGKQFIDLCGKPVLARTLEVFENSPLIRDMVIVTGPEEHDHLRQDVLDYYGFQKVTAIVAGGKERQDSVWNGLMETQESSEYVAVHDGARPLLTSIILENVLSAAFSWGAAVAAVPIKDTIKISDANGFVSETPERSGLWSVQTPQVFRRELLMEAFRQARKNDVVCTDDAALVERLGYPVKLVNTDYENIKITTPEDLEMASAIIERRNRDVEGGNWI